MDTILNEGWTFTNPEERPEEVIINGEKFLKVPQISRTLSDGSKEIHPSFMKQEGDKIVEVKECYIGKPYPIDENTCKKKEDN